MYKNDVFWLEYIPILYIDKNYLKIYPTKKMTLKQILNSISLTSLYIIIILLLFGKYGILLYPIIILVICITIFLINKYANIKNYNININVDIDTEDDIKNNKYINDNKNKYKLIYEENKIRNPTYDNPYMNPTVYFDNSEANDINNTKVFNNMNNYYKKNMYKNIDDLYDTQNGMRNFYTVPSSTNPNGQNEFALYLYNDTLLNNCKFDQNQCIKYKDLRYGGQYNNRYLYEM